MYVTLTENVAHTLVLADAREEALHTLVWDLLGCDEFNLKADEIQTLREQHATKSYSGVLDVVAEAGCPVDLRPLDGTTIISPVKMRTRLAEFSWILLEPIADAMVAKAEVDLEESSGGWGENMGILGDSSQLDTVFVPKGVCADLEGKEETEHDVFTLRYYERCMEALELVGEGRVSVAAASILACVILERFGIMRRTRSKNPDEARVARVHKAAQRARRLLQPVLITAPPLKKPAA